MNVKIRIKQIMSEKGITEYRLAKLSGLSQSTISNIFNRNTDPTIPTIEAICKGLGISLSQFFYDEQNEEMVSLTKEQKELFNQWIFLSQTQKDAVKRIIESYSAE